jgi:DnaK suppressor protein
MWTQNELKNVRELLVAQLGDIQRTRTGLQSEVAQSLGGESRGIPSETPQQWSELSNRLAEEDVAIRVLNVESVLQKEILDAIERIDQNCYGVCERCGKRITKERLRVVAHARHCIECAQ